MAGSIRQRGRGTELRVYLGLDPDNRRRRYATRTVHGTRRAATAALATWWRTLPTAGCGQERWGAPGTVHDCRVAGLVGVDGARNPQPDALPSHSASRPRPVIKLTAADIDDVYSHLFRRGGRDDRPLSPGTVHRVHVVLHRALTQAVRWEWI